MLADTLGLLLVALGVLSWRGKRVRREEDALMVAATNKAHFAPEGTFADDLNPGDLCWDEARGDWLVCDPDGGLSRVNGPVVAHADGTLSVVGAVCPAPGRLSWRLSHGAWSEE